MSTEKEWMKDVDEFESEAGGRLEAFLETLQDDIRFVFSIEGFDRDGDYGLHISEGFTFIYTRQGSQLAKNMIRRLYKVGKKYFPNDILHISSCLYKEL